MIFVIRISHVTGNIAVNRSKSCYITQQNNLRNDLCVEELMHFCCNLRLRQNQSTKQEQIESILNSLKLNHLRSSLPNKLSGGERKRLSVAVELISKPEVFFLDEPTSGLDEIAAVQCMNLLKELATQGRTIICTIHQPSPMVLKNVDHVYVMTQGQCIYQGQPKDLISYMQYLKFECPTTYTPIDYGMHI